MGLKKNLKNFYLSVVRNTTLGRGGRWGKGSRGGDGEMGRQGDKEKIRLIFLNS